MALSADAVARLAVALTSEAVGNEVASAINSGGSSNAWNVVAIVQDALASTTLAVALKGDLVLDLTTVANNLGPSGNLVATSGTLPYTPTLHDVLVVVRPVPAATSFKF